MDRDELQHIAEEHLAYELEQMALGAFTRYPAQQQVQYLANITLEAYMVHVRVLDEFLGMPANNRRDDDVLAIDYCPNWTQAYPIATSQREDINKRVAHLTSRRTKLFRWEHRERLAQQVLKAFKEFMRCQDDACADAHEWIRPGYSAAWEIFRGAR